MQQARSIRHGFTLIELSMVLVIIGLIVSGIVISRELIKTAQLRKLGSQVENYKTAVNAFKIKYHCLPGDCSHAQQLFGTDADGCQVSNFITNIPGTCNGDGDGMIETFNGVTGAESSRVWEMLSHASLVSEQYTTQGYASSIVSGRDFPSLPQQFRRTSRPLSVGVNSGVGIYWHTYALFTPITGSHVLMVGTVDQTYSHGHATLTPVEAKWIDSKYDDGSPVAGKIRANTVTGYGDCQTGSRYRPEDEYTYRYSPGPAGGIGCALFFAADF